MKLKTNLVLKILLGLLAVGLLVPGEVYAKKTMAQQIKDNGGSYKVGKTVYSANSDGYIVSQRSDTTPDEDDARRDDAAHAQAVAYQQYLTDTANAIRAYEAEQANAAQLAAAIAYDAMTRDQQTYLAQAGITDKHDYADLKLAELVSTSFRPDYVNPNDSSITGTTKETGCVIDSCYGEGVGSSSCEVGGGEVVSSVEYGVSSCVGVKPLCDNTDITQCDLQSFYDLDLKKCFENSGGIASVGCSSLKPRTECMGTSNTSMGFSCGNGGTLSVNDCGTFACSGSSPVAQIEDGSSDSAPSGCTAFCAYPQCGQDNLCGGKCGVTDGAAPAKTPLHPPDGSKYTRVRSNQGEGNDRVEFELKTVSSPTYKINSLTDIYNRDSVLGDNDVAGEITVSWGPVTGATHYQVQLYPFETDCSHEEAYCTVTEETEYSFVPLSTKYTLRARAINPTCLPSDWMIDVLNDTGVQAMSSPPPIPGGGVVLGEGDEGGIGDWEGGDFEIDGDLTGMVKLDQSFEATLVGGICTLGGASGQEPGDNSAVTAIATETYGTIVEDTGDYTMSVPQSEGAYNVSLVIGDADRWRCTCPEGCTYSGIEAPTEGLDFFVSNVRRAWFQVDSGNVHADGGNVSSFIPDTCVGGCSPYLITGETGLPSYTGSLSLGSDFDTANINETGDEWRSQTDYKGDNTDYGYFARILQDDPDGVGTWDGTEPGEDGVFLGESVAQTLGGDWSIAGGQKSVLLVPGDLVIENNIDVAEGSFLAIISEGNITIDDAVTDVEGVFIADGIINSCETGSDVQLIAGGIFVGWSGINLCRDFGDDTNNTQAVERFVYRPDLQVNAYNYLLKPQYRWQEVAP